MAKTTLHCSFCGRSRDEVKILIAGQEGHICENCVEHAREIIEQELMIRSETGVGSMYAWNNNSFAEKTFASSAAYNPALRASFEKSVGTTIVCITENYDIKLVFFPANTMYDMHTFY